MVLAEASGIGGRQIERIRLTVGEQVLGSVQSRFDGALVADSGRAAKFSNGVGVKLKDRGELNPNRLGQRANSRIAGAYRCINSRARATWRDISSRSCSGPSRYSTSNACTLD